MTDRDLTPAEARAEVEAFMGEGWTVDVHGFVLEVNIEAKRGNVVVFSGWHRSPRAAVAALKQAWRDAVRPWVDEGVCSALDSLYLDTLTTEPAKPTDAHAAPIISRVLKEDDK